MSGEVFTKSNGGGANLPLGVGQTWQNMTASRAVGVTYTNTTGHAIMLSISGYPTSSSGGRCGITINGEIINAGTNCYLGNAHTSNVAIIPSGATYLVTITGSPQTSNMKWYELR